jgi:hypothetical protein
MAEGETDLEGGAVAGRGVDWEATTELAGAGTVDDQAGRSQQAWVNREAAGTGLLEEAASCNTKVRCRSVLGSKPQQGQSTWSVRSTTPGDRPSWSCRLTLAWYLGVALFLSAYRSLSKEWLPCTPKASTSQSLGRSALAF